MKRSSRTATRLLAVALCLAPASGLAAPSPTSAPADADDDVDALGLAAVLLDSGHADRAREVLLAVDPDAPQVDRSRLFTLLGVTELSEQRFSQAIGWLEEAIAAGQSDPNVHVMLAKARYGADDAPGALRALESAGDRVERDPAAAWLFAECLLKTGDKPGAWRALRRAADRFPHHREIRERELTLLVELGLFAEVRARAPAWLSSPAEHLRLVRALLDAGCSDGAAELAELARLRFPDDERVVVALAQTHAAADRPLAAARLLDAAARDDVRWAADAAELYRRAGRTADALRIGAAIPDADKKLRQRFGMLLDAGRFEEAAALGPRLERRGLLADDALRYGVAYALFRSRQLDAADAHARRVTDAALFRDATELRAAIARCHAEDWRCQ